MQLIGSLTDGDIRRGLLNGFGIDDLVVKFMNTSPKHLLDGENNFERVKEFKSKGVRIVPVLDQDFKILKLIDLESKLKRGLVRLLLTM